MKYLVIGVILILIFIILLWLTLKTKSTDMSASSPYSEIIGQQLITQRRSQLLLLEHQNEKSDFPYLLEDGSGYGLDREDIADKIEVPKGAELRIEQAGLYTNGTSGFTHSYLFGRVKLPGENQEYAFQYTWGIQRNINSIDENQKPYWEFPLAVWQVNKINQKFTFPTF